MLHVLEQEGVAVIQQFSLTVWASDEGELPAKDALASRL